jgi:sulfide:quinone oxidoreductase
MALHDLAEDRVEITLAAPEPEFLYKPLGRGALLARSGERRALEPLVGELGARFCRRPWRPFVRTITSRSWPMGPNWRMTLWWSASAAGHDRPAGAITFGASGQMLDVDELLREANGRLVVPPVNTWPLPIYELALMSRRRGEELGLQIYDSPSSRRSPRR